MATPCLGSGEAQIDDILQRKTTVPRREYQLFQDIVDAHSDLLGRIRDDAVWTVVAERPLTPAARAAGVRSDRIVWLGGTQSGRVFQQPVRVLEVATAPKAARKSCSWRPVAWIWPPSR
jgi:hypothetical protein